MDTVTGENPGVPALGRFRDRVRRQLRDDVLDAAYGMTVTGGWSCARMTALADRVGVSRQTVYKEFGSRDEVGRALVLREAARLVEGMTASRSSATTTTFLERSTPPCLMRWSAAPRATASRRADPCLLRGL